MIKVRGRCDTKVTLYKLYQFRFLLFFQFFDLFRLRLLITSLR